MSFPEKKISAIDLDDMRGQIGSLYEQIKHSISIMQNFKENNTSYKNIVNNYNNILIIGMGGSAIGADFARTIVGNDTAIPIFVARDYSVPGWVDEKTFVIASSYSGNTEETLASYNQCMKKGCDSIVISTGGELSEIATSNNTGVIVLPLGYQPRAAIGYSLTLLLLVFMEMGLIKDKILIDIEKLINRKYL